MTELTTRNSEPVIRVTNKAGGVDGVILFLSSALQAPLSRAPVIKEVSLLCFLSSQGLWEDHLTRMGDSNFCPQGFVTHTPQNVLPGMNTRLRNTVLSPSFSHDLLVVKLGISLHLWSLAFLINKMEESGYKIVVYIPVFQSTLPCHLRDSSQSCQVRAVFVSVDSSLPK